jgi:hypothetical protein
MMLPASFLPLFTNVVEGVFSEVQRQELSKNSSFGGYVISA